METVGSDKLEVFTSLTHLHDLTERKDNTLRINQSGFTVDQHVTALQDIMFVPSLVGVTQRLFDLRFRLRVEDLRFALPLVTNTRTLRSRLAHMLLVLINALIYTGQIISRLDTQTDKDERIRHDHYARIYKRVVIHVERQRNRHITDGKHQTDCEQ